MRFYEPGIGKFIARDMIRRLGRNPYAYVDGNPTRYVDPSGLDPQGLAWALAWHWFAGGGKPFTRGGQDLKQDEGVRRSAQQDLLIEALRKCSDLWLSGGGSDSGTWEFTGRPQPSSMLLVQTTNVPSKGFKIKAKYNIRAVGSMKELPRCCWVKLDAAFRWQDRADIHPERHPFPDAILAGWQHVYGLGEEYDIDIGWKDTSSIEILHLTGRSERNVKGWPFVKAEAGGIDPTSITERWKRAHGPRLPVPPGMGEIGPYGGVIYH